MKNARILVPASLGALALAAGAWASAPPVGALPPGPTKQLALKSGATVVVSLPKLADPALVWRVARPYDARVVTEQREGEPATRSGSGSRPSAEGAPLSASP